MVELDRQAIIESHPAFRRECRCDSEPVAVLVTYSGAEPAAERRVADAMCAVCIEQSNALGILVERVEIGA